jgi:hypothetical protein
MNRWKKIGLSLISAAALFLPNLTKANPPFFVIFGANNNNRCEPHYSPYAFGYHNNGLVSGTTTYSPYALNCRNPGLVDENRSYSPYALSYHNSGLVPNSYSHYPQKPLEIIVEPGPGNYPLVIPQNQSFQSTNPDFKKAIAKENAEEAKKRKENDGIWVIQNYLRSRKIEVFVIDRTFRAENELMSVNFVFRDKKIVIKYWNSKKIESLDRITVKSYERYKEDWEKLSRDYLEQGYKIHEIRAKDKDETLSSLEKIIKSKKPSRFTTH